MKETILIVDDESGMRDAISETLKRAGHSITTANNGLDALGKFEMDKCKLVITDMKMPNISGLEVLREIKKISSAIPVIMLTAYGTIEDAVLSMKEGAFDYLLKPFSSEALNTVVERALTITGKGHEISNRQEKSWSKEIITNDAIMLETIELANTVAPSYATVLIQGESGTGKELFARFIHKNSTRSNKPFVGINCASLPDGLLESELFGHEKGSFTGAIGRKLGKFELAKGGTILLDEISEMDIRLQAKLLRVLQEQEIDRVGGREPILMDARVIATTNRNLRDAVEEGKFRKDLFYRLNVVPIKTVPLRERKGDIPLLAKYFLNKFSLKSKNPVPRISDDTISLLMKYDWRGNVRELENIIERAFLLCKDEVIHPKYLFLPDRSISEPPINNLPAVQSGISVKEMERQLIFQTLEEVGENRTKAAKILGISIRTLRNKLSEYRNYRREENFL